MRAADTLTLAEMRDWLVRQHHVWTCQTGPNDSAGYERDAAMATRIRCARTWAELAEAAPLSFQAHVANRTTNP